MEIIKIAVIGIVGVLLAVFLKPVKSEFAVYTSMGTCLLILFFSISKLESLIETIKNIQSYISIQSSYIMILLKIIGITYIAEFSANICKDAGYNTVASQIEIFGKLAILVVSMPVLTALLDTIHSFLS